MRGATGRVLRDLAMSFVRNGWHVTVITAGEAAGDEFKDGVRVIRVKASDRPRGLFSYLKIWLKMFYKAMTLPQRDVVVSLTDPPLTVVFGSMVARFKKSRHIHWCHDLFPDVLPALGMGMPDVFMSWLRKRRIGAMNSCDKIIVCGRCMEERLVYEGVPQDKIAFVPNWPDIELIDPEVSTEKIMHYVSNDPKISRPFEEQVKGEQRFRILYAGNLGLAHPTETLLKAAEYFQDKKSDIEFVFVGDGARFDDVSQYRTEKGLTNVRLLPFQPASRLREVLESGDVHVITMKEEAAGYVVPCKLYSAMAVARPSIFVGPVGSEVAKVITEHEAGLIVASDDVDNMIKAIKYFRHNAQGWFDAHRGATQARDKFRPEKSMKQWRIQAEGMIPNQNAQTGPEEQEVA